MNRPHKISSVSALVASAISIHVIVFGLGSARAQIQPMINLYSDSLWTSTELADTVIAPFDIYVVIENVGTATTLAFQIVPSDGFTAVWVSEWSDFPIVFGSSPTGVEMSLGTCASPPVLILTVRYVGLGTSGTCSSLQVSPHPDHPGEMVMECTFWWWGDVGGRLHVNPIGDCTAVPIERTTWGAVKSLYRE